MGQKFEIGFLEEARQFILEQDDKTRAKILQNIEKAETLRTQYFEE